MMADDPLNVIVIGHNTQSTCYVANEVLRARTRFKQFDCDKLNSIRVKTFTYRGIQPYIITTPCLGTPLWVEESNRLKEGTQFRNKAFIYVKDLSTINVDDKQSIARIKRRFPKTPIVIVIPYHHKKMQTAEYLKRDVFDKSGFSTILVKFTMPVDIFGMIEFSKSIFSVISKLKPVERPENSPNAMLSVDDDTKMKRPHKEISKDPKADKQMEEQIKTVNWNDQTVRSSTPNEGIHLTNEHWQAYIDALFCGSTQSFHTRVNVVGYQSAGKTTLVRRLQEIDVDTSKAGPPPTEGLDVHRTSSRCLEIDGHRQWETNHEGYEKDLNHQRMAASLTRISDDNDASRRTTDESVPREASMVNGHREVSDEDLVFGSEEVADDENMQTRSSFDWNLYDKTQIKSEYLQRIIRKKTMGMGMRRYISYWDFAGQATYYTTHQLFLAPAAVYLLVMDLSKPLEHEITDSLQFRAQSYQRTTVLDAARFWVGSIKSFASDENNVLAPIIVVGTHADKVQNSDAIFEKVREVIGESELSCIAVDNTKPHVDDEKLHDLRDRILDKAIGISQKKVQATWIDLEYMLLLEKEKGQMITTFDQLKNINTSLDKPLSEAELPDFLEHEHCDGFLMYFNVDCLNNIIILQPSILVKIVNLLMLRKPQKSPIHGWSRDGFFNQVFWEDAVNSDKELENYKKELLDLLVHLKIVFTMESNTFFMPCLLGERPHQHARFDPKTCEMSRKIRISFQGKLVPQGFFHSLLVSCLFAWKCDEEQDDRGQSNWQVFYRYCRFQLPQSVGAFLEMSWSESQIFIQFINMSRKTHLKDVDIPHCLNTIQKKANDILRMNRHEIDCVVGIECPSQEHTSFVSFTDLTNGGEARCLGGETKTMHLVEYTAEQFPLMKNERNISQEDNTMQADCLPNETRLREITDREFVSLCNRIVKEYFLLFILLGLDKNEIDAEREDNRENVKTTIFRLFKAWSNKKADQATVGAFLRCLPDLGINEKEMWDVFR